MEFDDLKRTWQECDGKLDGAIHLDHARLRLRLLEECDDIDYSAPVLIVQKQIDRTRPRKWWLVQAFEKAVDEMFHASVARFRGRKRVLRG